MKLLSRVKESIAQMLVENQSEWRSVKGITLKAKAEPVYNFTTENHTYCVAGGVVVHNCDTISMLSVMKPWKPTEEGTIQQTDNGIWEFSRFDDDDSDGRLSSYVV